TLLIITAFAAAVVGRLRSLPLTYVGALILAIAIGWSNNFLLFAGRWTNVSEAFPAIMLFIVLLLLPRAELRFARTHVIRRIERVSTVRDTLIGMAALFVAMWLLSSSLSDANLSRFALGMCTALVALSLVPVLVPLAIGVVACVSGALWAGSFGLATVLSQADSHLRRWKTIVFRGPCLAALGIIRNPAGAGVEIGEGIAPLLPWRKDARRE